MGSFTKKLLLILSIMLIFSVSVFAVEGYLLLTDGSGSNCQYIKKIYYNLETDEYVSKTLLSGGGYSGPCFNPTGDWIAYYRNGGIYVFDTSGTYNIKVCDEQRADVNEEFLSWTDSGYLYWSEWDNRVFRVEWTGATPVETVIEYNSITDSVNTYKPGIGNAKVSRDGKRCGATLEERQPYLSGTKIGAYRCFGLSLEDTSEYVYMGGGCQGTISPNGVYVTHNITGTDHKEWHIQRYADGTRYKVIKTPPGTSAHRQRWSHNSNEYVVYSGGNGELVSPPYPYIFNIETEDFTNLTATIKLRGAPFDFFVMENQGAFNLPNLDPNANNSNILHVYTPVMGQNGKIQVQFSTPQTGIYDLNVFDISGRNIVTVNSLANGKGIQRTTINNHDFSNGIYFIQLKQGTEKATSKFVVKK
jgi:hypothetical protein